MAETQHDNEEDYYLAPQDQRAFGAGIKRKRIAFVPASTDDLEAAPLSTGTSNIGAKYLSIVLSQSPTTVPPESSLVSTANTNTETHPDSTTNICPICKQPVPLASDPKSHESSIAHQVCLEHSHPPSHLDRQRKGLKYLEGYGWDPDSRLGLGARSEGIRAPVRAKEKKDTAGLGLFAGGEDEDGGKVKKKMIVKEETRGGVVRLNAKQVRKVEQDNRKKAEKLRSAFYSEDLSQYLGPGG